MSYKFAVAASRRRFARIYDVERVNLADIGKIRYICAGH